MVHHASDINCETLKLKNVSDVDFTVSKWNCHLLAWIIKKASEFQKNIYFCFIDYAKTFDCVDHNKL